MSLPATKSPYAGSVLARSAPGIGCLGVELLHQRPIDVEIGLLEELEDLLLEPGVVAVPFLLQLSEPLEPKVPVVERALAIDGRSRYQVRPMLEKQRPCERFAFTSGLE